MFSSAIGLEMEPHKKLESMTDELVNAGVEMRKDLDAITPKVNVFINGVDTMGAIEPMYHHLTIAELLEAYEDRLHFDRLLTYLHKLYAGVGVPYQCLEDETKLKTNQIDNWLCAELEMNIRSLYKQKKDLFVPHELVAEMISVKPHDGD